MNFIILIERTWLKKKLSMRATSTDASLISWCLTVLGIITSIIMVPCTKCMNVWKWTYNYFWWKLNHSWSFLYLTVSGIIWQILESIGQFKHAYINYYWTEEQTKNIEKSHLYQFRVWLDIRPVTGYWIYPDTEYPADF